MLAENILRFISFNMENFDTIQTAIYLIITLLILLIIFWFIKDLTSRVENIFVRVIIFLGVLITNIPGFIFYLVLRPRETNIEKEERIILEKRQEAILIEDNLVVCPNCTTLNKKEYSYCVHCSNNLDTRCKKCNFAIQPFWNFCPRCKNKIIEQNHIVQKEKIINKFNHKIFLKPLLFIYKSLNKFKNSIEYFILNILVSILILLRIIYSFFESIVKLLFEYLDIFKLGAKLNEAFFVVNSKENQDNNISTNTNSDHSKIKVKNESKSVKANLKRLNKKRKKRKKKK